MKPSNHSTKSTRRWLDARSFAALTLFLGFTPLPAALKGEYFAGRTFNTPVLQRTDATIDFDWGTGSPDAAVPDNDFSARWTGFLTAPTTETWTLFIVSDNGSRLKLDGKVISDNFNPEPGTETGWFIHEVPFEAGKKVPFELEYYESDGGAGMHLYWLSPTQDYQIIPASAFSGPDLPPPPATGWTARYFDGRQFEKPVATRNENAISYEWAGAPLPELFPDHFSVKWSGLLTPAFTETYTFSIAADNGTRLWVDGQLVSNNWDIVGGEDRGWNTVKVPLTAGKPVSILLDYYQVVGGASAALYWDSPSQPWQLVPGTAVAALPAETAPFIDVASSFTTTTGTALDLPINASDATGATLTFTATGLPPGVSLVTSSFPDLNPRDLPAVQTTALTGSPELPGTYEVEITATSASGATASGFLVLKISGPAVDPGLEAAVELLSREIRVSTENDPARLVLQVPVPQVITDNYNIMLERSTDLSGWVDITDLASLSQLPSTPGSNINLSALSYQQALADPEGGPRSFFRLRLTRRD
jgi:hypothetical protein